MFLGLGIGTGNPGVFQGYLHLYPRKPVPVPKGMGFDGYGYGFYKNPGVLQPACGYASRNLASTMQVSTDIAVQPCEGKKVV